MADRAVTSAIDEAITSTGASKPARTSQSEQHATHHGSPSSWVAISIIVVGFTVGGIAMLIGPTWWVFWLGTGIVVVGGIMALSMHVLDDWY